MKLAPATVAVGQDVSLTIMGDTYDREIAAVSATGKTITLDDGKTARWNVKRERFQIGQSCSRGYATCVIDRVPARLDPHV